MKRLFDKGNRESGSTFGPQRDFLNWWPDLLGLLMIIIGVLGYSGLLNWSWLLDLSPELIGMGITVILIDNANELLSNREEKKRLILQMGSPDKAFALEAVRQLIARGWLCDGSVRRADLRYANLSEAKLSTADLSEADLSGANLHGSYLYKANLRGTNLREAQLSKALFFGTNLRGAILLSADLNRADLRFADLSGANLQNAKNLTDEQLVEAILDENTTLPDGSHWQPPR